MMSSCERGRNGGAARARAARRFWAFRPIGPLRAWLQHPPCPHAPPDAVCTQCERSVALTFRSRLLHLGGTSDHVLSVEGAQPGRATMSDTRASFGDELRRLRSEASFSQEELAERAGLSRRGISDLERGARHRPYLSTVGMLADALALGPDDRLALRAAARPERPLDLPQSAPGGLPLFPSPLT